LNQPWVNWRRTIILAHLDGRNPDNWNVGYSLEPGMDLAVIVDRLLMKADRPVIIAQDRIEWLLMCSEC
jgi:hypothetical protein